MKIGQWFGTWVLAAAVMWVGGVGGCTGPVREHPAFRPQFNASPEDLGDVHVYFGNLHSHTSYSDGSGKPRDAYKHARDTAGVDFLAITEHNHKQAESGAAADRRDGLLIAKNHALYNGSGFDSLISAAKAFNEDGRFVAIYGQEYSSISSGNHVNVFEVGEVIDENVVPNGRFDKLMTWLASHPDSQGQPAICQFNHPSLNSDANKQYGKDDFGGSVAQWRQQWEGHVRTIEILNGPAMTKSHGEPSDKGDKYYLTMLHQGFHLAPSADQDNHYRTWGDASDARTGVVAPSLTKAEILKAIRGRHVYATTDKNLSVVFWVNGRLFGDRVSPNNLVAGNKLKIEFTLHDADEPDAHYKVEVLTGVIGKKQAEIAEVVNVNEQPAGLATLSVQDVEFTEKGQFVLFRVKQINEDGDDDWALTAPVWFDAESGGGAVVVDTGDAAWVAGVVASRNSAIYHTSADCPYAKAISDANKLTGAEAIQGRTAHEGCGGHP